jgi:hypothetical protein
MHAAITNRLAAAMRWSVILAAGCWSACAGAATLSCPSSTTLESLVACVSTQMPQDGSNGYVAPTAAQRADFRTVFEQMLAGNCGAALPASLASNMQLRSFQDSGNGRNYCLLMEVTDNDGNGFVDKGWGTFITYANAAREVTHQAPHPKLSTATTGSLGDAYTESEAIRVFKQSDSRGFAMCGARRGANTTASTCQPESRSSDCAHNTDNLLHASTEQLLAHYGPQDFTVIQWHGMAADTCQETAYVSHGYSTTPPAGAKTIALRDAGRTQLPSWLINTPDTACTLNATDNPQGRLLNGVAAGSVCAAAASAAGFGNKFIHVEQDVPELGADLSGVSGAWAQAVAAALPASQSLPAVPTNLAAAPGDAKVSLSWSASNTATSYRVKRSTVSGGPYGVIGTSTTTALADTNAQNGTTYYYVASALNAVGESANSAQVAAKPVPPPPPPSGLAATAGPVGSKSVVLQWTASAGATNYQVKRSTSSGGSYAVVAAGLPGTSFTDTGLKAGRTYYYYVNASNASGTSANSNQASAQAR